MKVYAISIEAGVRTIPNKAIEWVLKDFDWFRLMNGRMYFVATDSPSEDVYEKLKNVLHGDDLFFISIVKTGDGAMGFLPAEAWTWLKKYLPTFLVGEEISQLR